MSDDQALLLQRVKEIEFAAKSRVLDTFSGMYVSCFKGQGIELADIREYQNGDDVRAISWTKMAQLGRPFVKTFHEERDLIVMLVADISGSLSFGSLYETKRERLSMVGALLAFTAMYNRDRVGLILFSDRIEKVLLPKRGERFAAQIIRDLLAFEPKGQGTNVSLALNTLNKVLAKRAICFLLTDFLDSGFEKALEYTAKKDDLIAVHIHDPLEKRLGPKGLYAYRDIETQKSYLVEVTSSLKKEYEKNYAAKKEEAHELVKRLQSGWIEIDTQESFLEKIIGYFTQRKKVAR